ncbi:MAG: DUF47 domain-containing protein [Armatimonadota bacterium]
MDDVVHRYHRLELDVEKISDIEHEADDIVHEVVRRLNTTFVTPALFDREDIYRVAERLDDIIDQSKGVIDRLQLFNIEEPTPRCVELSDIFLRAAECLQTSMKDLSNMEPSDCEHVAEINALENQGDVVNRAAMSELFEYDGDPRYIMKWLQIYQFMEGAIDACEGAANLVEAVVVKNA